MRVAARPCSPGAGLGGAQPALTSRPAAGTVQRGHPTSAGSRGGGAWPWLGQRGLPEGQRTRLLGTQSAQGERPGQGTLPEPSPGPARKASRSRPGTGTLSVLPERCLQSPIPSVCGGESPSVGTRPPGHAPPPPRPAPGILPKERLQAGNCYFFLRRCVSKQFFSVF